MKKLIPNRTTKEVLLGTLLLGVGVTVLYFAFWAVSKIFTLVHEALKAGVFPWLAKYWWILLIVWGVVTIAATIYHNITNPKVSEVEETEEQPEEDYAE